MNKLVENKEMEQLSKEDKLVEALANIMNQKLTKKAILLYRQGIYEKSIVDKFDLDLYEDVTYNNGYHGYQVLLDEEGNLFFAKELNVEEGETTYGYEVISFPNVSDEEYHKLCHFYRPFPILKVILISGMLIFQILAIIGFFSVFFNILGTDGFIVALANAFSFFGTAITLSFGLLCLILKKGCNCKGKH